MKQTKKSGGVGKAMAIGASVAALGAGAYYLLGPDGKKNQKKIHNLNSRHLHHLH